MDIKKLESVLSQIKTQPIIAFKLHKGVERVGYFIRLDKVTNNDGSIDLQVIYTQEYYDEEDMVKWRAKHPNFPNIQMLDIVTVHAVSVRELQAFRVLLVDAALLFV